MHNTNPTKSSKIAFTLFQMESTESPLDVLSRAATMVRGNTLPTYGNININLSLQVITIIIKSIFIVQYIKVIDLQVFQNFFYYMGNTFFPVINYG